MARKTRKSLEDELSQQMRAWQNDQDAFDEEASRYLGLNRTDMRCLDIADQHGRITAGELAREARVTTGALTAVIDRLEEAGLMRRVRDESDRRKVYLEVTDELARRAAPVWEPMSREVGPLLSPYTTEELELFLDLMRRARDVNRRHAERVAALPRPGAEG
jgi:DNA-binding MarR family transcriptional regulator